ncbi:MAG: hypothetical protein AAGF12_20730 [Myxococcota bacterium]
MTRLLPTLLSVLAFAAVLPSSAGAQRLEVVRLERGRAVTGASQLRVGDRLTLGVRVRALGQRGLRALPSDASVRWMAVRPEMQHRHTPPPNEGIAQYSNAVLFGPNHGRWLGLDRIEYFEEPLADGAEFRWTAEQAGSRWFAAEATLSDGTVLRTPGASSTDRLGLDRRVFRVSVRSSDDFLGWLSTYFGVPNIFGSIGPQVDRYVGADCADVLVGALRAYGHRPGYASVSGIGSVANPRGDVYRLTADGEVVNEAGIPVELEWNVDVSPGDFLAIDYVTASGLPRSWDHIGALLGDADGDGALSPEDGLRHMSPQGLVDQPLRRQGPIRIRVFQLRNRYRVQ